MQEMWDKVQEFWAAWGPWISLTLIPTIITGLSLSPRTSEAATALQKVWDNVKKVLDLFSFAKFKNEPGTYQLPLKLGEIKKNKKPTPPPGPAVGLLLLVALGSSCSGIQATKDQVKEGAVQCAGQAVEANTEHLLPVVVAILTGTAPNWRQMLTGLVKEVGRDAVACALQKSTGVFQAKLSAAGSDSSPEVKREMMGLKKARMYTAEQNWTFTEE